MSNDLISSSNLLDFKLAATEFSLAVLKLHFSLTSFFYVGADICIAC